MENVFPWEYTTSRCGEFKRWTSGSVSHIQLLAIKRICRGNTAYVNGVEVHSLIFETASAGNGNYARWDCIHGWTTTLAEARKNFPTGLHGQNWDMSRKTNKYNKRAENLVRETIASLEKLLPKDGEDISYYNPGVLNEPIRKLIDIKILLACANEIAKCKQS